MKKTLTVLLFLLLLAAPAAVRAQSFGYSINPSNSTTITITNYTGPGGAVAIPPGISGLVVTGIGAQAFSFNSSLTSVAIPGTVTSIANQAFSFCSSLTNITISDGVTGIGSYAFWYCTHLTTVTIPASVTNIGSNGFSECSKLQSVSFQGNAPSADATAFSGETPTIYHLPGTTGWSNSFAGAANLPWNALILTNDPSFGISNNLFGFKITATNSIEATVAATTNFIVWTPLTNVTLNNNSVYFSDPHWTNYPNRFYILQMP